MNPSRQAVIVAFLVGCITGVVGGGLLHHHMLRRFRHGPDTQRLLSHLTRELSLDAGQQDKVKAILEKSRVEMDALHKDTFARMEQIRGDLHAQIEPLLHEDQKPRFEKLKQRWEAKRRMMEMPPPPPPP